ncbi:MAG: hypothetical protein ILNGONEN_00223 [Syntrophorhabdaceae bacterium]|nr:hypothetical protein [Syntrophorhabdaceae bacterium]
MVAVRYSIHDWINTLLEGANLTPNNPGFQYGRNDPLRHIHARGKTERYVDALKNLKQQKESIVLDLINSLKRGNEYYLNDVINVLSSIQKNTNGYSGLAASDLSEIKKMLSDDNKHVRKASLYVLGYIEPKEKDIILGTITSLADQCEDIREMAFSILEKIELDANIVLPELTRLILYKGAYSTQVKVRKYAAIALGRLGLTAIPVFKQALEDENANIEIINELSKFGLSVVPIIKRALRHQNRSIRNEASRILVVLGSQRAMWCQGCRKRYFPKQYYYKVEPWKCECGRVLSRGTFRNFIDRMLFRILPEHKWKTVNEELRLVTVSRLDSQWRLALVAVEDSSDRIAKTALDRIHMYSCLCFVALNSIHDNIRVLASERLRDDRILVKFILAEDGNEDAVKTALAKVRNQSLLTKVAREASNPTLRLLATKQIYDDSCLAKLARQPHPKQRNINWNDETIRNEALKKISDDGVLGELVLSNSVFENLILHRISDTVVFKKISRKTSNVHLKWAALNAINPIEANKFKTDEEYFCALLESLIPSNIKWDKSYEKNREVLLENATIDEVIVLANKSLGKRIWDYAPERSVTLRDASVYSGDEFVAVGLVITETVTREGNSIKGETRTRLHIEKKDAVHYSCYKTFSSYYIAGDV